MAADCPPSPLVSLQEMFRQGDRERELGQPISPLMDRTKGGVTKSQTGFFKVVALPQFTVSHMECVCVCPACQLAECPHLPATVHGQSALDKMHSGAAVEFKSELHPTLSHT